MLKVSLSPEALPLSRLITNKLPQWSLGSFENFSAVLEALNGVYGAYVNTDGFTVGEARETYAGMRIFELAKQLGTLRHYIWSNLDYSTKVGQISSKHTIRFFDVTCS